MYSYRTLSPRERADLVEYRREQGYPAHSPPHSYDADGWFLITAATYEHAPFFSELADRDWLREELTSELDRMRLRCAGWAILPNHYHVLVRCDLLETIATVVQRVHGRTSRELNRRLGVQGRRVWYRYSDRQMRSERHYFTTLNYLHYNPVKHGYVQDPLAWPSTSIHWYLDHHGTEWLDSMWSEYPLRSYGQAWDSF